MHNVKNAIVESVSVRLDRECFLSVWVMLDYGGTCQGFGGYVLGGTPDAKAGRHAEQFNLAAEFLVSVMRVCGVDDMSKCQGKAIRAKTDGEWGDVVAIGHITKDIWFNPREVFDSWKAAKEATPCTT